MYILDCKQIVTKTFLEKVQHKSATDRVQQACYTFNLFL